MRSLFRAKAVGGITPHEADRRQAAVEAALAGEGRLKPLPPPIVRLVPAEPTPAAPAGAEPATARLDEPAVADVVVVAPASRSRPEIQTVTIEISGVRRAGKSTIAHMIRAALSHEGIVVTGPDELPSYHWRRALDRLYGRGIRVVLTERETEETADGA